MTKHDFEKHPIAVGQVWKNGLRDEITIGKDDHSDWRFSGLSPYAGIRWYNSLGICIDSKDEGNYLDLVELIYDPNIVAIPTERVEVPYVPKYDKNKILNAIIDNKAIDFRVDEGEDWQSVKDNNWVLKMLGDKTPYCFRVSPVIKEIFMVYNIYAAKAEAKVRDWEDSLEVGDTQVKYTFEDDSLVKTEILNNVCF